MNDWIPITCPHCQGRLEVEESQAGQSVFCGLCQARIPARTVDPPRTRPMTRGRAECVDRAPRSLRMPSRELGLFSLLLGVASLLVFCVWPLGLILSGLGLLFAFQGLRTAERPLAVTGLTLSGVGLIFAIGMSIVTLAVIIKLSQDDPSSRGATRSTGLQRTR